MPPPTNTELFIVLNDALHSLFGGRPDAKDGQDGLIP